MDISSPWDMVTSYFINLYLTMVFPYLESTLHVHISCCYVGQTSDKLSGCQEQPLLKGNALDSYWLIAICVPLSKVHELCMNELNGIPIKRLSSPPPKL